MPKLKLSEQERLNRELLAALRAGQIRLGESDNDTAKIMPRSKSTYYRRITSPESFTVRDIRIFVKRYGITDYQLCRMFGAEYHGSSLA